MVHSTGNVCVLKMLLSACNIKSKLSVSVCLTSSLDILSGPRAFLAFDLRTAVFTSMDVIGELSEVNEVALTTAVGFGSAQIGG